METRSRLVGTIIKDLSKAFDTINHNWLKLFKLNTYDFSFDSAQYCKQFVQSSMYENCPNTKLFLVQIQ